MDVDPYEDEVPESFDDGTGVGDVVLKMEGNPDNPRGVRGRKRTVHTTRKVWTFAEKCKLMSCLNDLVAKGYKCDNSFKSGYLLLLENMLSIKFLGTDLKGEPQCN
ncbi:hypothetical protein ACS0TY_026224 [Phlomoides rotata]